MSVFTGGPYVRLAIMLNTLSSLNIEIIKDHGKVGADS